MANDKNNEGKGVLDRLPKAKRHRLVKDISTQLRGAHLTETFEVYGRKYRLRTLEPGEEEWADGQVVGMSTFQVGKSMRMPRIAVSLVAVDDVSVEELFELPEEGDPAVLELIADNKEMLTVWRRQQILDWIKEDWQPETVTAVYDHYLSLVRRRGEAMEKLHPFSKRTSTGGSAATSSPEKESSSPTPP